LLSGIAEQEQTTMSETWTIQYVLFRQKEGQEPKFESFSLEMSPEEYVLDGVEKVWAFHDRSLTFQHACHHSVCGACGMRVNGVEKLTCITKIKDVTENGGTLVIEPMRNFPIISDLVVDMSALYSRMEEADAKQLFSLVDAPTRPGISRDKNGQADIFRLGDCIECGLCISACPIAGTDPEYLGPAILAAVQTRGLDHVPHLISLVDTAEGVWRCHSAYECTEVCPSNVEPGWRIMDLRKQVMKQRVKNIFGGK
jgi:succinate dehydrogenase / fumarate reductase iron-sulfur subunit